MEDKLNCFMAYDVRGRVPEQLDEDLAYQIGRSFATLTSARQVVVGRDVRLSSAGLTAALSRGLMEAGVTVIDIGLCGTELVYFATSHLGADGGIMVTASHNPKDYNGMKFVGRSSVPLSGDSGLPEIRRMIAEGALGDRREGGTTAPTDVTDAYITHLLGYVEPERLRPLTIVTDAGNGCVGPYLDRLEPHLPVRFVKLRHNPDGEFPTGVPNPMLEESRALTARTVHEARADLGLAWDGDFDRCFFFDERARFVEGYYLVGLLAEAALQVTRGAKVIHDPRLVWNTREVVTAAGGIPVQSRCGHAFIKAAMRAEDAVYGGEMSAHHYFKSFFYCDSGMISWLLTLPRITERPLSELLDERMARFPVSGEINRRVTDADACISEVLRHYEPEAVDIDRTDGIGLSFARWRFNLRKSNTEPLIRLNVEARDDQALMEDKTAELLELLG